jgi:CHAT domain-containing protein
LIVKRQKVTLRQRDGTVLLLNACDVGATDGVLGKVGGWADAFLAREFRAFVAPLWASDDEDAAQVTAELMQAIVTRQQPLAEGLRDLRAKYGAVSRTF